MNRFFKDSTVDAVDNLFKPKYSKVGDFKLMSHYDAALYTARRLEMCEIVEMTLFYFIDRPQVHSALSGLPFMRALQHDMPHRDFFSCLRESDQDFYDRSGWVHQRGAAIYLPDDDIIVLPPPKTLL